MNTKKLNQSVNIRVIASALAVLIFIVLSFISPLMVYMTLALFGILIVYNVYRIEHIYTTARAVDEEEEPMPIEKKKCFYCRQEHEKSGNFCSKKCEKDLEKFNEEQGVKEDGN